jgi:hypothetical protein
MVDTHRKNIMIVKNAPMTAQDMDLVTKKMECVNVMMDIREKIAQRK